MFFGIALPRWNAVPASAQEHTHTATPAASAMPMPMASQAPAGAGMGSMMHMMMPPPKSAADRGYMGAMMQIHGTMMRQDMTGNADRDFVMMMIPHHQAAVAMAQTELKYGTNTHLRNLAQHIIAAQQAEIRQMRTLLESGF